MRLFLCGIVFGVSLIQAISQIVEREWALALPFVCLCLFMLGQLPLPGEKR